MHQSPVILAIDTATSTCSVALAAEGSIEEIARDVGQRHTEHILSMVDEVLLAGGHSLGACDAIAFGSGPGSFTGLRVACGVAQGLAYGIDRPVVPVGNLAATACDAFERDTRVQRVLVAQDARMNEAYWAVYERAGERVEEIAPPALAAPEQLAQLAAMHRADAIAGNGLQSFSAQLGAFEGTRIVLAAANARAIATLALDAVRRGRTIDAAAAVPLYVRDRVALTVGERRARAPSADL